MKKVLCYILAFCLLFLIGCGSNKDTSSSKNDNTEIETAISSGKIKTAEYGLGASAKEVTNHYKKIVDDYEAIHMGEHAGDGHEDEMHVHDANDEDKIPYFDLSEKGKYTEIDVADYRFYYETQNENKGIVAIATDTDVFGFVMGNTTKQEVEKSLDKTGKTLNATNEDNLFLAFPQDGLIIFRCTYEERELDFYFYENLLVTAVIKTIK